MTSFAETLERASGSLGTLAEVHETCGVDIGEAVAAVVSKHLSDDFARLADLRRQHVATSRQQQEALERYGQLSARKSKDKGRFDVNAEVYASQRAAHMALVAYVSELNVMPKVCPEHAKQPSDR